MSKLPVPVKSKYVICAMRLVTLPELVPFVISTSNVGWRAISHVPAPQRVGYRDRDAVLDASDPTPAEAAGRSAAGNDPPVTDAVPDGDANSLDGVSVSSAVVAAAGPASVSQPDADLDSESDDDLTPSVWFVVYGLP